MEYLNKIALLRTGLTMLIVESVKAAGGHISTYYKSTGIPYQNIRHANLYGTPPIKIIINPVKFSGAGTVTLMHMTVKNDGVLRIIYNDSQGCDNNTISDYISLESICEIVKWLQSEMLLLAPRQADTCMHCGSFKVQKEAMVELNNDNAFLKYYDEVGSEGNWCPSCQHIHYGFVKYDHTDIPHDVLNKWWDELPEETKHRIDDQVIFGGIQGQSPQDEQYIKYRDEFWKALNLDIKRKIWCNFREF